MKNIQFKLKRISAVIVLLVVLSSCQNLLDDIYDNPNAVTEIDDAALFTNAVRSLLFQTASTSGYRFAGQHAHYLVAGSTARRPDQYGDNFDDDYYGMYSNFYGGVIRHIEDVLQITSEGETKNEVRHAMADVIAVMGFAVITDAYGDVPYTEGGKGKTGDILTPKYDTQQFIYSDMISRLAHDIDVLKNSDPRNGYPGSDPLFENDLSKWVKLANSFRLRLAMRLRYADNTLSRKVVADCLAEPLMEDPSDDASLIQTEGNGNRWYSYKTGYPLIKVSEMMVNQLTGTSDPRLPVFVSKDANGKYEGQLNGLTDMAFGASKFESKSNMGDAISSKDSKYYVMTAAETWLLRAEAALAYDGDAVKANDYYRMGIETSLKQWKVDTADILNFLAGPTGTLTGTVKQMEEQIGTQMWIALTPDYFEGWSYIRRMGYPVIEERRALYLERGVTKGMMPSRFKYSSHEISTNGTNVQEAIDRQGPNSIATPVWWDKKQG
jgi:hypothetical protein